MIRFLDLIKEEKELYLLDLTIGSAGIWQAFINLMGKVINLIFELLRSVGIENAALCIIIFTIIVKALMIPLNIKQQKFSKMSSKMQPEMQKIQKKYKDKKDQESMRAQSMEMNDLYERYGVSPTGGCLPLLITMPVIFALYRVIYNIPDHIAYIGDLYDKIANSIVNSGSDYNTFFTELASNLKGATYPESGATTHDIVSLLSNLKTEQWTQIKEAFPACSDVISACSDEIISINRFIFGMNIADWPTTHPWPGLIIPVLAVAVQWFQTKQINTTNEQQMSDNPTAQSMMMMTKIMPFFSGIICLSLPIGVGIYWIVSGVFQIIQQALVNKHMENIDIDEIIEKNKEKARKKKIRMGLDPDASFSQIATQNSKSISNYAKNNNSTSNYSDKKSSGDYKKGSISAYANMSFDTNSKKKNDK